MIPVYPIDCDKGDCKEPLDRTAQQAVMLLSVVNALFDDIALRLQIQGDAIKEASTKVNAYLKFRLTKQFKLLTSVTDMLSLAIENKLTEQQVLLNYVAPGIADMLNESLAAAPAADENIATSVKPAQPVKPDDYNVWADNAPQETVDIPVSAALTPLGSSDTAKQVTSSLLPTPDSVGKTSPQETVASFARSEQQSFPLSQYQQSNGVQSSLLASSIAQSQQIDANGQLVDMQSVGKVVSDLSCQPTGPFVPVVVMAQHFGQTQGFERIEQPLIEDNPKDYNDDFDDADEYSGIGGEF